MNEALRLVAWLTAGGGGGMVGGVDLGWVFTSAGESGIVPTFCTLLPEISKEEKKEKTETVIKMELQHKKKITLSKWRQLVKEEHTDIFTWEPSIVSLNQKPHKKNQNKSMQRVEMNPNLYCVGDSWAWETHTVTPAHSLSCC